MAPAVVLVLTNEGFGSGAILDGQGHVITNWHVVGANPLVVVVFKPKDGTELTKELAFLATVEKIDQVADLALLKIHTPPKTFTYLPLGDVSTLAVGQDVYAIGHPEGEVWTYTKGIISQIRPNYTWSTNEDVVHRAKVIQTQTPVNPGSSGGPLLDDSGRLIGINSFRSQGEGLNYAVAVDEIQAFLKRERSRESLLRQSRKPQCKETYDTTGQGWTNIVGCYTLASTPPPDLWFVYRGPRGPLAYGALGSVVKGEIDTVISSRDQQWQNLEYYMDVDCNGTIDLIGYMDKGSVEIDRYRVPETTLRMVTLAKELDNAIKRGGIPYSTLRVCQ
ncbi:MAG: trypsin-like peptidase domain-containing protein [candidate division NC10 bacterium]|nr:trypsin-like peptidase domain-containing protein [candidate division NC10 bacterium]